MMRYNYIPAPHSIYQGIAKLPAGRLLTIGLMDGIARAKRGAMPKSKVKAKSKSKSKSTSKARR